MILADVEGAKYNVHFHYCIYDGKRTTFCTIHRFPCLAKMRPCGTIPAATGHAECSHRDEFRKSTGRKIALARAMKILGIPRPKRAEIWTSYLSKVNGT